MTPNISDLRPHTWKFLFISKKMFLPNISRPLRFGYLSKLLCNIVLSGQKWMYFYAPTENSAIKIMLT